MNLASNARVHAARDAAAVKPSPKSSSPAAACLGCTARDGERAEQQETCKQALTWKSIHDTASIALLRPRTTVDTNQHLGCVFHRTTSLDVAYNQT
jgi:hypothetical protein